MMMTVKYGVGRFGVALLLMSAGIPAIAVVADEPPSKGELRQEVEQAYSELVQARVIASKGATDRSEEADVKSEEAEAVQPKVWLGITLKEISGDLAAYLNSSEGVLVENVFPDSPAEKAKLAKGDIVVAFNGEKVSDPAALIEALRKFGDEHAAKSEEKDRTFPKAEISVLRRGKELALDITPVSRPEPKEPPAADPNLDQFFDFYRNLQSEGSGQYLRFGPPSTIYSAPPMSNLAGKLVVIVIKDKEGKNVEVRIERNGNEPAVITVTEGGRSRTISEAELEVLPENVRKIVTDVLSAQAKLPDPTALRDPAIFKDEVRSSDRSDEGTGKAETEANKAKKKIEQGRKRFENDRKSHSIERGAKFFEGPDGPILFDDSESLEEIADKFRAAAEALANRSTKKVQDLANMPEQLKQLRSQVDELKQQVSELQEQLKANAK